MRVPEGDGGEEVVEGRGEVALLPAVPRRRRRNPASSTSAFTSYGRQSDRLREIDMARPVLAAPMPIAR